MTRKVIVFTAVSFFLFVFALTAYCEEGKDTFPFLAEINTDNVNVRAGQNINFERLTRISKPQEVVVVAKSYDWYKIKLPGGADCFVSEKFVSPRVDDIGMVTANRVNLRAGASEKASIIGQLQKEARVRIKGLSQGWYKIEPPEGAYGWIEERFIVFKSNQIPPAKIISEPSRSVYKKETPPPPPVPEPKKEPEKFSVVGRVEDSGRIFSNKDIRYKLVINDKTAYYLDGDAKLLDSALHYTVRVVGDIRPDPDKRLAYPVIVVSKINSIL